MQKWEYCQLGTEQGVLGAMIVYHSGAKSERFQSFAEAMKKLGLEGWELVSVSTIGVDTSFFFKRPL